MFFILKWSFIAIILSGIWYGISTVRNLPSHEKQKISHEALHALETGETHDLTGSFATKIKEDFLTKKAEVLETIRNYMMNNLDNEP